MEENIVLGLAQLENNQHFYDYYDDYFESEQ